MELQTGQSTTFTVGLLPGYGQLAVTGAGGWLNGSTYTTGIITSDATVTASASNNQLRVRASIQNGGGTISPGEVWVDPGGHASFTLSLDNGFKFKNITGMWLSPTVAHTSTEFIVFTDVRNSVDATVVLEPITEITDRYIPEDIRMSQSAIFSDEFTSTQVKLTLHSKYAALNHLTITAEKNPTDPLDNTVIVPFFDDGTHGDDVAGDGTYTALFTPSVVPYMGAYGNKVGTLPLTIIARDNTGTIIPSADYYNYYYCLAAVDRSATTGLTHISDTEFSTTNLVNYIWPGINSPYRWDRTSVCRRLLAGYGDVFDLVTIRFAGMMAPGEGNQNFVPAGNLVQGIGKSLDPEGGLVFGSSGVLRGVIQMGEGQVCAALLHEIGHSSCFYLDDARLRLSDGYGHITRPTTMIGQDNFSLALLEQASGDFQIGWDPSARATYLNPYSKMELYLMGLIPAAEVTPERFLLDPSVPTNPGTLVPRDKTTLVRVEDLIAVYGPRVPDAASTSKTLRMGFVVLSDRPLVPAEVALEHLNATYAESRPVGPEALQSPSTYWYATGGRASLTSTLPPRKP